MSTELKNPGRATAGLQALRESMQSVIRGKDEGIESVLVALVAGGHVLIEDIPGLGKTSLAYSLARAIRGEFSRIQFTSDLLPADVLGVSIYDDKAKDFVFKNGPVFSNILLADEINRTTPKTQSALLEVMDRGKITVDGETRAVGNPFLVLATQNPVDFEGTFPLPDSQMDRFLMRLEMGYPGESAEMDILRRGLAGYDQIELDPVVDCEEILQWQGGAKEVYVEDSVLSYLLRLVTATRTEGEFRIGISTRGSLALKRAAQARAFIRGRDFILPEDIRILFLPVCAHRIGLKQGHSDPREARHRVESFLEHILETVRLPD